MIPKVRSNIIPKAYCSLYNNTYALNVSMHVGTNPKKSDNAFIADCTSITTLIAGTCGHGFRGRKVQQKYSRTAARVEAVQLLMGT